MGAAIEGYVREADYIWSQYLHMRPRPIFAVIGLILQILVVAVMVLTKSIVMLGLLLLLAGLFGAYIPLMAKRSYRQYKAMKEKVSITIVPDGIVFRSENGKSLMPWDYIVKWRKNRKLILIYPSSSIFHLVPRHFFSDDASYDAFANCLSENVGKSR